MTPRLGKEDRLILQIPPKTRLNLKLSKELNSNSKAWSYSVLSSGSSTLISSLPAEKLGDSFAPSLHILKSRLDAALERASALLNPGSASAGSKRKLEKPENPRGGNCASADGGAGSAKLKSSIFRRRAFRTSSVRTSTQRRPKTRVDEYVIESSSSEEESEGLAIPLSKKSRVGVRDKEFNLATGAGFSIPHEPTYGEEDNPSLEEEASKTPRSSSAFVTSTPADSFAHGEGVRTSEPKADSRLCPSDETRQGKSCKASNPDTTSSSVNNSEAKTNDSRYGTLPVNLKRPELVTSAERLTKKVRRNADQTIPALGPTEGHGCAGPGCDPNELEGAYRSRVAPFFESASWPKKSSRFEDSLVHDSQEDYELEDFPVLPNTLTHVVSPTGCNTNGESNGKYSVPAEGPMAVDSTIKSASNEKQPQRGRLDATCSSDAKLRRQEAGVSGRSVLTRLRADSVSTGEAAIDIRPGPMSRGVGVRITPHDTANADNPSFVSELTRRSKSVLSDEVRHPGYAGNVNSKLAEGPDGSGKYPIPGHLSNVFRTGRGNIVQISPSAMDRVMSLFDDDSPHSDARSDVSFPAKSVPRAKPLVTSAIADAQCLLSVKKNLYTHSYPKSDDHERLELDVSNQIRAEANTACLFQTGRGKPVGISSESIRRVRSIFARPEPSPPAETFSVRTPSTREASSLPNHEPPSKVQSSLPICGREDSPISGDAKGTTRDSYETGPVSRSSLFRTARDAPVSISSAALQKIQSILENDELTLSATGEVGAAAGNGVEKETMSSSLLPCAEFLLPAATDERSWELLPGYRSNTEAHSPVIQCGVTALNGAPSSRSLGASFDTKYPEFTVNFKVGPEQPLVEAELCERANQRWDKSFDPRLGLNGELRQIHDNLPSHVKLLKDSSLEASDGSFSFQGSSGRTLRVSSAAKAKAEALLKLGPEFVTPPKFEAHPPSSAFNSGASKSVAQSFLDVEERRYPVKECRKQVNGDLARKIPKKDSGGELWTKAFKAPRVIRPLPTLYERQNIGLQSARGPATRPDYLLPPRLHYLHNKTSRWNRGRLRILEYFGGSPRPETKTFSYLPKEVLSITADTAETYRIPDGDSSVGVEDTWMILRDFGADQRYASQGWTTNHFKWIVWKLASYERKFPHHQARLLTLSSVLNELKYRYDRELIGERSALKRVTERDASASHTMVLCVSAVRSVKDMNHFSEIWTEKGENVDGTKRKPPSAGVIEVTDGWYRLNAHIDVPLARRIHSGKLKAGQKIVVCGATLEGISDGLPPLQAYHDAYLSINSNGVRRARWDQRLGFCGTATPLAFKHITEDGGIIPHTYVAITRRYPVLHREKLGGGGYILRSDRAEDRATHAFDQRRAKVAEEVIQKVDSCHSSDEGAKLFAVLETAADPESLLLDMTRAQLDAFAAFKARREESMQTAAGDLIKTALESQGLATREVIPTFKVRVVGLNRIGDPGSNKDGLVTIWHATEELQEELQEGKVFCVYGLRPSSKGSYHSFSSTRWRPVSRAALENKFTFPYAPRARSRVSDLSEYMSCREFDVAGLVLFVTDPVIRDVFRGRAKSQWVFMTDGSCGKADATDAWEETQVLAIEILWPEEAFVPFESSLVGRVVGYCNLWLKHRDHSNRLWVAEASDRALYSTKMTSSAFRHLTSAAFEVQKWAKLDSWNVDLLQSDVRELAVHF